MTQSRSFSPKNRAIGLGTGWFGHKTVGIPRLAFFFLFKGIWIPVSTDSVPLGFHNETPADSELLQDTMGNAKMKPVGGIVSGRVDLGEGGQQL